MINKTDLVNRFCEKYGTTKTDTATWVSAFIGILTDAIEEDEVKITGFGSFKYKLQAPRMVRDFDTGDSVLHEARYKLIFDPSAKIRWMSCEDKNE